MIAAISSSYSLSLKQELPLFGVTLASLADYITTEKDHVKKISRMPDEKFLMGKNRQKIESDEQ